MEEGEGGGGPLFSVHKVFLWRGGGAGGGVQVWEGEQSVRGRDFVYMRALVEFGVWVEEGGQVLEVLKFGKEKGKGGEWEEGERFEN